MKNFDIYKHNVKDIKGRDRSLEEYKGRVLLIVNTASRCGFTPQYAGLEELHKEYGDKGLAILGFPCNQFAGQEPESEETIAGTCLLNYGVTFDMFSKIKVNGPEAHPLFRDLRKALPGFPPFPGGRIKWNFTKFLIDRDGKPVKRFSPRRTPESLVSEIKDLL